MRRRHIPERSCVVCRKRHPQPELIRLRKTGDGWSTKATTGRSVYLCASADCRQEKRLKRFFGNQSAFVAALVQSTEALKP
ncbi:MAG: DUF448 domain-containing protein [Deinococcaceae bacterium]